MLTVENVHFSYRDGAILNGVDLQVGNGELVAVVGPNGAGKTTLLRLITGVLRPSGGQVTMDGADIHSMRPGDRARMVSVVPQNPQLPLSFSVLDLVLMGRNPHLKLLQWESQRDLDIARHAMELTETDHLAERAIGTLSGGERQRAVVAMALAQETPVLLLDEPTSSLDLAHQTRVLDLVSRVQKRRGGSVLIAMHDLTLAAQYCNRIIMLAEGRSYAQGPPEKVLTRENISTVYGADVYVLPHPVGGTPVVLPLSQQGPADS